MSVEREEQLAMMDHTTEGAPPVSEDGLAPRPSNLIGVRHLQVFLMFLCLVVSYLQRVDLSVGIVAMMDRNSTGVDFPEYQWDATIKGNLLASFFWGYAITQIPAGQLAQRFGPKLLLAVCLFICSLSTILMPVAAEIGGWRLLCGTRVVQGLTQGFVLPCLHCLLASWTPMEERGRFVSVVYSGGQPGTILAMLGGGALASSSIGWPSIFYVFGAVGFLWVVLWIFLVADHPGTHKFISKEEQAYIEKNLGSKVSTDTKRQTPWVAILTSLPMWAVLIAHCGNNWGYFTLLTEMPSFMNSVLKFDLKSNGLLSALPYLVMWLLSFVFSWSSDFVNKKNIISLGTSRKVFNSIGHWGPGLALLGLNFIGTEDTTAAVALLTIAVALNSAIFVGFLGNHIDLSPNYAGIMMGITSGIANFMSLFAPMLVGLIVTNEHDVSQWHIVFYIASGIFIAFNLFFVLFGKAEIQPWNDTDAQREKRVSSIDMKETDAKEKY